MVEATGAAPLWPCGCVMGDPACRCGADPGVPAVDPAEAEQTLRDYAAEPDDYATEPGELAYAAETVLAALDAARAEVERLRTRLAADKRWNDAIDWLLNSRHTADPDIQGPFWDHVDGKITLDELRKS